MLVKYYLSDNIKVPFENFDLSLGGLGWPLTLSHESNMMVDFTLTLVQEDVACYIYTK